MRVIHVIPGLNPSSGPSQALARLASHQQSAGLDVSVCYVSGRGRDVSRFPPEVPVRGFPAKFLRSWAYAPALRRHLTETLREADILHVHSMWLYPNIAASRAAWDTDTPYLIRPAGSLEPWCIENSGLKKKLYLNAVSRRIMDQAARIHAVSEQESRQIDTFKFQSRVVTIPNGIELLPPIKLARNTSVEKLGWPPAKKYLLFLSRIHPKKGLDVLFDAFEKCRPDDNDLRLIIAGPDNHDYANQLKSELSRRRIEQRVHFIGEVLGESKALALQTADLFVLPSRSENFGIAILEALAAGTGVVVSRETPWGIVEDRKAGYWLPLDVDQFAGAICSVINDDVVLRNMGLRGLEVAREFSWSEITERNIKCYEEILQERAVGDK